MLDRLSPLQRHCLAALEVECFMARMPSETTRPVSSADRRQAVSAGPLYLVVADAVEATSPLVRSISRALGADLVPSTDCPGDGSSISVGTALPVAELCLPTLTELRHPQVKRECWQLIRRFLRQRRHAAPA